MQTRQASKPNNRAPYYVVTIVVLLYLALATNSALTERPGIDEGLFANPAFNLLTRGSMGSPVIEEAGTSLKNINKYTYWIMPLHILNQAGWYRIFGFSLLSMRSLSAAWGLVALVSWFLIMQKLSGNIRIGVLAVVLISLDYTFIQGASWGRMDMMSAALGFAGLATYLSLRERNLWLAVLLSQSLVVASGMTHPNGLLSFAGLLFLTLYFDRTHINWRHVAVATLPYLIGAVGWGLYIAKDPSSFPAQFSGQATMGGRLGGFASPWVGFIHEFTRRYPVAFGLGPQSAGHTGPVYLKSLILLAYVVGLVGALLTGSIRNHRGFRALLILAGIYFVTMSVIDGQKQTPYLVHIIPIYASLLAIWVHWCWTNRLVPVPLIVLCLCGLLTLQIGGIVYRAKHNTYQQYYVPVISFLKHNSNNATQILGNCALGFGLRFPDNLVDDVRLGYASGKRPDLIVVDEEYEQSFKRFQTAQPEIY